MSIINLLSSSLGVRNEIPNQKLAWDLSYSGNSEAIKELVENLQSNKDKRIQSDCIKVLYEIGYKRPELISGYCKIFVKMLTNKNNRLVWGSMIALSIISVVVPGEVYQSLSEIMKAIDKGSVITIDAGVEILSILASQTKYQNDCFPLLIEQLKFCPPKQLSQYAEKAFKSIHKENRKEFSDLLHSRISELENDSQRKKIQWIIKRTEALK